MFKTNQNPPRVPKGKRLPDVPRAKLLRVLASAEPRDIAHAIGCSVPTLMSAAGGGRVYGATAVGILSWLASNEA